MFNIELEYPTSSENTPRYTPGKTNKYIEQALSKNSDAYKTLLTSFNKYFHQLSKIDVHADENSNIPYYKNLFLPGLDAVSLYCLLAEVKPDTYLEIGSGNSTKFARQAIVDNNLKTRIISIDPYPRAEIDQLCAQVIRTPLETIELDIFDNLKENDVVFFDGSHRCFMNSDVTAFFLDIMPRLNSGIYLQIHDIFWPIDYPIQWKERYYNEQYLLGTLLANGLEKYEIILPNFYISLNSELINILDPLWTSNQNFKEVEKHGCSFWMRKK
jgi:hypothetical protein